MAIYLLSNHLGIDGMQVARSLEIVGVHIYAPCLYIEKL